VHKLIRVVIRDCSLTCDETQIVEVVGLLAPEAAFGYKLMCDTVQTRQWARNSLTHDKD
jgi:hypothetical protein